MTHTPIFILPTTLSPSSTSILSLSLYLFFLYMFLLPVLYKPRILWINSQIHKIKPKNLASFKYEDMLIETLPAKQLMIDGDHKAEEQ